MLVLELRLARLAFEEGQLTEAERLTDAAVATVSLENAPELHHLRAPLFLAQGKLQEANVALQQAGEPSLLLTNLGLRLQRARLRAVRGTASEREAVEVGIPHVHMRRRLDTP